MSRFTNLLQLSSTGQAQIITRPLHSVQTQESFTPLDHEIGSVYALSVLIRRKVIVGDELAMRNPGDAFTGAVRSAKRAMVEELFGEFREPLVLALADIDGYDLDAAKEKIEGVLQSMFDVR